MTQKTAVKKQKRERQKAKFERQVRRAVSQLNSKDGYPQVHPSVAFTKLVGLANQKALEPVIFEQIKNLGQALAQRMNQADTPILLRLKVIEDLLVDKLGISQEELANKTIDLEDKINGYAAVEGPTQTGDYVRSVMRGKENGGDLNEEQQVAFQRLNVPPYDSSKDIEEALIGLKVGETATVTRTLAGGRIVEFTFTIVRISRKAGVSNEVKTQEGS